MLKLSMDIDKYMFTERRGNIYRISKASIKYFIILNLYWLLKSQRLWLSIGLAVHCVYVTLDTIDNGLKSIQKFQSKLDLSF